MLSGQASCGLMWQEQEVSEGPDEGAKGTCTSKLNIPNPRQEGSVGWWRREQATTALTGPQGSCLGRAGSRRVRGGGIGNGHQIKRIVFPIFLSSSPNVHIS